MDKSPQRLKEVLDPRWIHFGRKKNIDTSQKVMDMIKGDKLQSVDDSPLKL